MANGVVLLRLRDLLSERAVALNVEAESSSEIIDRLVLLHEKSGSIYDSEKFKAAILAREKDSPTAIGEGIAVPHAKSPSVIKPALSAATVPGGVDYNSPDGEKSTLFFMIAAPSGGDDAHLEILSRLMVMLMDSDFCRMLRSAKTSREFIELIDREERKKYPEEPAAAEPEPAPKHEGYRILAVTACPTGIAHTYMAAEALEKAGARLGYPLKAETNGSGGVKNKLTKEEIANCDGIIIAADKNVDEARFDGKPVIKTSVSNGINKPDELIQGIINGSAPIYHSYDTHSAENTEFESETFGRKIYKHLMNGVSHMLPFVVGGGVLIAIGFLIDSLAGNAEAGGDFGSVNPAAAVIFWIGKAAFAFMLPILSGYIAQSIADRPGLLPGIVGGYLATTGATLASPTGNADAVSGFLGALLAGFAAGIIVNFLKKLFSPIPKSMDGIKPVFLYPLFGTVLIGVLMLCINPFVGYLNLALSNGLSSLGETSRILLSVVLAAMMAIDMGGPFNKAAYVFGTAAIADGNTWIMAAVMIGGMIPPIAIAISTMINKQKWTSEEIKSGPVNYLMGLCFITEGAIPYAASDPLHVIPSCMIGSAVAGALTAVFGCACPAPHGGIFVFAVVDNPLGYIISLAAGSVAGAIALAVIKRNRIKEES